MRTPLTLPLSLLFVGAALSAQCEIAGLSSSGAAFPDAFGVNVDTDGFRTVVGADGHTVFVGEAYVFEREPGGWTEQHELFVPDGLSGDLFGTAVALSGDTILVGARRHDHLVRDGGAAYVFELVGGAWVFTQELFPADPAVQDEFGRAVEVTGDTAFVSSLSGDGAVYVFERAAGIWAQTQRLTGSDAADGDQFGDALDVDGETLVIGSRLHDAPDCETGSVYVFERAPLGWFETDEITADVPVALDLFGESLDLAGDRLAVGAPGFFFFPGAAYVFERGVGGWTQVALLAPAPLDVLDRFGASVGLSGDALLVGSPNDDDLCPGTPMICNSGAVYFFEDDGGGYVLTDKLLAAAGRQGAALGFSIATAPGVGVVGAPGNLFSGSAGTVHFFAVEAGVEPFGAGLAGTGGVVPSLDGAGCPSPGLALSFEVSGGRGGACGCLLFGPTQTAVPFAGGTLLVADPFLVQSFVLDGTPGMAGVGTFSLSLDVPADLALIGTQVFGQGGTIDPEAVAGVALTAGLAVRIE